MKTRSQTRKEKAGNLNRKIPKLNEDVLGIILKHVVLEEQNQIMKRFRVIQKHFDLLLTGPDDGLETGYIPDRYDDHVEWPDYLDSNGRRLMHHTNVKLFRNRELIIHDNFISHVTSKRELNLLWKTFKHFGQVYFHDTDWFQNGFSIFRVDYFFRGIVWPKIQRRGSLFEKLENEAT